MEAQHSALKRSLSSLIESALGGTDNSVEVSAVTCEAARVGVRLHVAKRRAAEQRETEQAALRSKQRESYDCAIEEGEKARGRLVSAFRTTCLAFGDYCVAVGTATSLRAAVSIPLGEFDTPTMMPQDSNRLRALITLGDLLTDLLESDGDLQGVTGYGYNLSQRVAPIISRTQQRIKENT